MRLRGWGAGFWSYDIQIMDAMIKCRLGYGLHLIQEQTKKEKKKINSCALAADNIGCTGDMVDTALVSKQCSCRQAHCTAILDPFDV